MSKILVGFIASACLVTSGCYSVPSQPDFTSEINGNYKAVADCAWMTFRTKGDWSKADLDSMNKVEFSFGNSTSTAGRIDIIGVGNNRTRIVSHMPQAAWGKDFWPSKHRPIFESCATK